MARDLAIGLDSGGFKIRGVLASKTSRILKEREVRFFSPLKRKEDFFAAFFPLCDFLISGYKKRIKGIGLGVASVVYKNKPISFRNIPHLNRVDFAKILRARYKLPVILDNDVKAAAFAEQKFGAAKGSKYMVMLTLGTGIGCGVVRDGKLFEGAFDSAFEIGRMIVDVDTVLCKKPFEEEFENLASAKFFLNQKLDPFEEEKKARAGNQISKKRWQRFGEYLGIGLANIVNLLEPETIVIGGGLSNAWQLFAPSAIQTMRRFTFSPVARKRTKVLRAKLDRNAGALGAALLVFGAKA